MFFSSASQLGAFGQAGFSNFGAEPLLDEVEAQFDVPQFHTELLLELQAVLQRFTVRGLLRGDSVRAVGEFAGFVELPESAESRRIFSSSTRDCLDSLSSEHGSRGLKLSLSDCYFSTELEKLCSVKACFRSDYLDNVQPNHMN